MCSFSYKRKFVRFSNTNSVLCAHRSCRLLKTTSSLDSSFAAVLITTTTRGRRPSRNVRVGRNKLLSQSTYIVAFLMRTGRICVCLQKHKMPTYVMKYVNVQWSCDVTFISQDLCCTLTDDKKQYMKVCPIFLRGCKHSLLPLQGRLNKESAVWFRLVLLPYWFQTGDLLSLLQDSWTSCSACTSAKKKKLIIPLASRLPRSLTHLCHRFGGSGWEQTAQSPTGLQEKE